MVKEGKSPLIINVSESKSVVSSMPADSTPHEEINVFCSEMKFSPPSASTLRKNVNSPVSSFDSSN